MILIEFMLNQANIEIEEISDRMSDLAQCTNTNFHILCNDQ